MPTEQAELLRETRLRDLRPQLAALPLDRRPLTLEIGCGHGHFATAYAQAHPDRFCLAIDLLADRLKRAQRKSDRLKLTNVAWIQAEASDLLDAWPEPLRVQDHLFILFPDPWPKRRHWKHRLVQASFLSRLARVCQPGTRLCFRTDHEAYFLAAAETLRHHADWQYPAAAPWPFEEPTVFQSRAPSYHSAVAVRR